MGKFRIINPLRYLAFLVLMVASSCSDWLSIAPENDLIKEKFWAKTADVNGALASTYNAFRESSLECLIWGELRADMVTFGGPVFSSYALIAGSDINPSNSVISWKEYYKTINLANTLMFYDKEVLEKDNTFTVEMMNAVDAEALFLRSLAYFYLVRLWKDVPLVLEPSISDTSTLFLPKNSENEVIAQIIEDLLKAKDMAYTTRWKDDPAHPRYWNGRANKYSIMTLLADVYLWDQQYKKCYDYCDSVINSGLYDLESNSTWFNIYFPGNSPVESIFEIQYDDNLVDQENPIYYDLVPPGGGKPNLVLKTQIINTILNKDDLRQCEPNDPVWKYQGKSLTGAIPRSGTERDANFIVYRYADILLMKAEAAIELNLFNEANSLIRQTVERAGMSHIEVAEKDDLRKALRDERGREFLIEGKRWFDILRAAKREDFRNKQLIMDMILAGAKDVQQQAILKSKVSDTMSYYLPIPERELKYNQNLMQNPYYDR